MSRWSTLFLGTTISFASAALLVSLGVGVGLISIPLESLQGTEDQFLGLGLGAGVYLLFIMGVSAFIGGYVASRTYASSSRQEATLHGTALWSLVTAVELVMTFALVVPAATKAASVATLGTGAAAFISEFQKANPRIVTDIKAIEGKIVTSLATDRTVAQTTERAAQDSAPGKKTGEVIRKALATTGLVCFLTGIVSLLSSIGGALVAYRKRNPMIEGAAAIPVRPAYGVPPREASL